METKELKDAITETQAQVKTLVEKQAAEIKQYGETTEATAKQLKEATENYDQKHQEMVERIGKLEAKGNRVLDGRGQPMKATPGMQFVMSDEFKNRQGVKTDEFEVGNLFGTKAIDGLTIGDGDDRAPVFAERVPELFYDPGQRQLRLRDIMNVGQTSSNAIEFFVETDFDEDGAGAQNGEGGTKNQLAMNFTKKTAPVETVAAWLPASRQVLDDSPMLQAYIDGRLTYAVEKELEDQILFGTGADGELTGIMSTPGIGSVGAPEGTDTAIDHLRKAIAQVRLSEYSATGIILNPSDWATLELEKGDDGHYIWVTVPNGGEMRLWRVPVIETTAMQEGQFLVGAFGLGAQLWDRMQSTIRLSDSHSDYFIKNAVAILGEMRAALTVYRPKAFVKGTLAEGVST